MSDGPDPALAPEGFARSAIRGSAWTAAQVIGNKFAAAAATFALGYLLQPADFGVAGFALSAALLVSGVHVVAFGDVLLAYPRYFPRLAGFVRRFSLAVGTVQAAMVILAGLALSLAYPERTWLFGLMAIAACRPLCEAVSIVPLSRLRCNLEYRRISMIDGVTALGGSLASVLLAFLGAGPVSIVAPPIAVIGARGLLYRRSAGPSPRRGAAPRIRAAVTRRALLAGFGSYVAGVLFALEILLLGALLPERSTGLFMFAFGLATQLNGIVSFQIAGALQPIFGHIGDDPRRQLDGMTRACRLICAILVPALAVQAAIGTPLIHVLWGGKWDDAAPIFVIMSIGQALYVCQWPAAFILKSQGRFRGYLRMQLMNITFAAVAFVAVILGGRWYGDFQGSVLAKHLHPDAAIPAAVAACSVLLVAVFGPATLYLAGRRCGMGLGLALDIIWRPWIACLPVALLAAWGASALVRSGMGSRALEAGSMAALGAVAVATGIAGVVLTSPSIRADARSAAMIVVNRMRPRQEVP